MADPEISIQPVASADIESARLSPRQRLGVWLFFGVILALLPLILEWLRLMDANRRHGLVAICSNGELLLISAVIAGGAVGELILSNVAHRWMSFKIWAAGSTVVLLAVEAGWYSDVASKLDTNNAADPHTVTYGSLIAFLVTVAASAACLYISATSSDA